MAHISASGLLEAQPEHWPDRPVVHSRLAELRDIAEETEAAGGEPTWRDRGSLIIPNVTVFLSSLSIMVVELVAGRLIARYVGSSLYTWTSVIGVVLAGIAFGNYVGGRIADRYKAKEALSALFLLASATCLVIAPLNDRIGLWVWLRGQEWSLRVALHVFCVFFAPSAVLGTIGPVAAKMALDAGRQTGRTMGSVYSWGAVGSICGTFLTGFYLIASWGTTGVLLAVAGLLVAIALFFGVNAWLPYLWAGVVGAAIICWIGPWPVARLAGERLKFREAHGPETYFFTESNYAAVHVSDAYDLPGVRSMTIDYLVHAYIDEDDPDNLQYQYEQVYAGVIERQVRPWREDRKARALFLGGGGFVFPRWLLKHYPGAYVEVAEIDPAVTEAAYEAFFLPRDTPMNIFHLDARNHVDDLVRQVDAGTHEGSFDMVFGDAFNHYSPPFHLTTIEFNEKIRSLLSPDGVFLANVIDIYREGRFLGAMIYTLEQSFPHVYAFCTSYTGPDDEAARDTFIVAASMQPIDLAEFDYFEYNGTRLTPEEMETLRERAGRLVLRDNYAPVDNLLAPVVRETSAD